MSKNKKTVVRTFPVSFLSNRTVTAVSEQLSADARRRQQKKSIAQAPSPRKRARIASDAPTSSTAGDDTTPDPSEFVDVDLAGPPIDCADGSRAANRQTRPKRRRVKKHYPSDEPLREFMASAADDYARTLLRNEGRGEYTSDKCPGCKSSEVGIPEYRCITCFGGALYCRDCILADHQRRPFCRIEKWTGHCFERTSLSALGLRIQLGHRHGESCPQPQAANVDFTVVHTNGVHQVAVDFCNCQPSAAAVPPREQLLRRGLLPATIREPQSCCTFEVLNQFHLITLHGKLTAYDYYASLERMTDNTGTEGVNNRYRSFLRCVRIWRYLKQLKRSGRANDAERNPSDVRPGELGLACPACPRPGVNLPDGWEDAPPEQRYLYVLFIALDACFRLKRRKISSRERDPSLADGGSYMVESAPFEEFIKNADEQTELSTCTGLSAVDHANTKYSKGYAETGKALGLCARHEFIQKNGVVPTQVGERYANTDYAVGSLLRHHSPALRLLLSYDISCQYSKKFEERMKKLPPLVRFKLAFNFVRFVVPKLHIHGHRLACQLLFNLNWTLGVGRTDGEGVERPWGFLGALCASLRQMGPGSAADTLDDHFGHWNWLKLICLGALLRRRLVDAIAELAIQEGELAEFKRGQAANAPVWEAEVDAFVKDKVGQPNPFEMPKTGASEGEVALELANEEADQARRGLEFRHAMTPSTFMLALLDVENDQRVLLLEIAEKRYESIEQQAELARRRTTLTRSINKLHEVQAVYSPPSLARLAAWRAVADNVDAPAERTPVFPPSALTPSERLQCHPALVDVEHRLREAQCRSSLDNMRNLLIVKSRLLTYKNVNVRHQGPSTRARETLKKNEHKIQRQARKYVAAHAALVNLAGGDASKVQWHPLDMRKDIRCMEDGDDGRARGKRRSHADVDGGDEEGAGSGEQAAQTAATHLQRCRDATGEGRRVISWIWRGVDTSGSSASIYSGIKVEYCKAYARKKRWAEEVPLLREEMRRTLVSLDAEVARWQRIAQGEKRQGPLGEGARAYAYTQANVYRRLRNHFDGLWAGVRSVTVSSIDQAQKLLDDVDAAEHAEEDVEGAAGGIDEEQDVEEEEEEEEEEEDPFL
ncbi:hypothetical protein GGG16DRAFT_126749 [Schizophyllum commune]